MLLTLGVKAQVTVESKIDSIEIFIGEQAHMTVDVTMKKGQKLVFPVFKPRCWSRAMLIHPSWITI